MIDDARWPAPSLLEGDPGALLDHLGASLAPAALPRSLGQHHAQPIRDLPALRAFLQAYRDAVLLPVELPAIRQAWAHASRNELRELLAFDQAFAEHIPGDDLRFASQAVGRNFLHRLQPLRDVRLVRRYWTAIQQRRAHGWHPLVYGVILAIYSVPLRPGLVSFAHQTLQGFISAGTRFLGLPASTQPDLFRELTEGTATAVTRLLDADTPPHLVVPTNTSGADPSAQ